MKTRRQQRSGHALVLTTLGMIVMIVILAFALDIGYLQVVRTELQRSADAAAIAATWELGESQAGGGGFCETLIQTIASQYSGLNTVTNSAPMLAYDDVVVGHISNPFDRDSVMDFSDPGLFNAVRVRVRRTANQNGEVPLFFARAMGINASAVEAEATAVFLNNFAGFTIPSSGENLGILPFAIDKQTWDNVLAGNGDDDWNYNEETGEVTAGWDGIPEGNLFPEGVGAPGNRGTVDIGSNNNSTADIARQILEGLSAEDLAHHGGALVLGEDGTLLLNGDTGVSAGVKDELEAIIGLPRVIPVFSQVSGPGNNAVYTIVEFAGIRIMEVKLTGEMSSKRVIIQPAKVIIRGGIPGTGGTQTSSYIASPVWLVR